MNVCSQCESWFHQQKTLMKDIRWHNKNTSKTNWKVAVENKD